MNLTRTSGTPREERRLVARTAAGSPSSRDRTGEEQIYLVDQRGESEWRQLTDGFYGFMQPAGLVARQQVPAVRATSSCG